jgi:hypothetical protein
MSGWRKRTIMDMAKEAGMPIIWISDTGVLKWSDLEAFAALVASQAIKEAPDYIMGYEDGVAAERELCAELCETLWDTTDNGMSTEEECYGNQCAAAIRARGQA